MLIGTLVVPIISFLYVYFVFIYIYIYICICFYFLFFLKGVQLRCGHLLRRGINPFGIMAILPFFFNFLLYI